MSDARTNMMGRVEFITLCAMMFATIAFSLDAMLPALPRIGAELSPDYDERTRITAWRRETLLSSIQTAAS